MVSSVIGNMKKNFPAWIIQFQSAFGKFPMYHFFELTLIERGDILKEFFLQFIPLGFRLGQSIKILESQMQLKYPSLQPHHPAISGAHHVNNDVANGACGIINILDKLFI